MAYNIPLPEPWTDVLTKSMYQGADLYNRLMLEKSRQAAEQENLANQLAFKRDELASELGLKRSQFSDELALKKAEFERGDPVNQMNSLMRVASMFKKRGSADNAQGVPLPNAEGFQQPPRNMPLAAYNQVESRNQANQNIQPQGNNGMPGIPGQQDGMDAQGFQELMSLARKNPIVRGGLKKIFSIDPFESALTGPAKEAESLENLRTQYGENSPVYQNAKAQYDSMLESRKDLRDLRERTKKGLKEGEIEFFDPQTGAPLGKNVPFTEKQRTDEEGNIMFNYMYPYAYNGSYMFSGPGATERLYNAASNYKTDPNARKAIDGLLLSDKVFAANVVNEASTLKSGHTNQTYNMIKDSLNIQDIPKIIKKLIKDNVIPPEANLKAAMTYQRILSDARKKASSGVGAYKKVFYNPELQKQFEENQSASISNQSSESTATGNKRLKFNISTGNFE